MKQLSFIPEDKERPLLDRVTIQIPNYPLEKGSVVKLGISHLLVCHEVCNISVWKKYLELVDLPHFAPYAGAYIIFYANKHNLFIVQPDLYIASHIIKTFEEMHPNEKVARVV